MIQGHPARKQAEDEELTFPAHHATAPPTEALSGLVERVTYHNLENGFCVLRVKARGQCDLVAVIRHVAAINAGEFINATGSWTTDREHGLQFRATHVTVLTAGLTAAGAVPVSQCNYS